MSDALHVLAALNVGELKFDGSRHATTGVSGDRIVIGTITVPSPIPPELLGKRADIKTYEGAYQRASISETAGDFSVPYPQQTMGSGTSLHVSFGGAPTFGTFVLKAGRTYYWQVENQDQYGRSTLAPGHVGDFKYDATIPS